MNASLYEIFIAFESLLYHLNILFMARKIIQKSPFVRTGDVNKKKPTIFVTGVFFR